MNALIDLLRSLIGQKPRKIQTFTYYIPAPPDRKTGYREKQFDTLFYHFINKGYEVLSTHVVPNTSGSNSGFWFVCMARAKNKEAEKLDLDLFINEFNQSQAARPVHSSLDLPHAHLDGADNYEWEIEYHEDREENFTEIVSGSSIAKIDRDQKNSSLKVIKKD